MKVTKSMRGVLIILLYSAFVISLQAGSSANYTLAPSTLDHGGLRSTSSSYTHDASAMPGLHGTASSYTLRSGYAGQLMDAVAVATGIDITATPTTIAEGGTRQLEALLLYDDLSSSALPASSVTWSVQSGPLSSVSSSGVANAALVYQDAAAVVQGTYLSFSDTLSLTVLNTLPDNFGAYAGDQMDDDWQVLYFGLPPNAHAAPNADPDADGQGNLFEFIAGLVPTLTSSRLQVSCVLVPGQPGHKRVVFSPRYTGRTYTVQSTLTLTPASWQSLSSSITTDDGPTRTVTDTNATSSRKLYRVQITKP